MLDGSDELIHNSFRTSKMLDDCWLECSPRCECPDLWGLQAFVYTTREFVHLNVVDLEGPFILYDLY